LVDAVVFNNKSTELEIIHVNPVKFGETPEMDNPEPSLVYRKV